MSNLTSPPSRMRVKVKYTYHDLAVVGAQAVTGIGFKPSSLIILAIPPAGLTSCDGFCDNSGAVRCRSVDYAGVINQYSFLIRMILSAVNVADAAWTSYDADGFTMTWSKAGTPTGTAEFLVFAFE